MYSAFTEASPDAISSMFSPTNVIAACILAILVGLSLHHFLYFLSKKDNEPPIVFSWLPIIGSTIEYGRDPYKFFFQCQKKVCMHLTSGESTDIVEYGDVFTFILIGRKHTVCLGPVGNNFVLGARHEDMSAADIYRNLTVPTFGKDVCYDCKPERWMEQKRVSGLHVRFLAKYTDETV